MYSQTHLTTTDWKSQYVTAANCSGDSHVVGYVSAYAPIVSLRLSVVALILALYPGRAAQEGKCRGVAKWGEVAWYTLPEVPKIWVHVIFGKLLRKTFP